MNRDIKQQWITALRSGEFTQGRETLRPTDNTYCCLGVLCELHRRAFSGEWTEDMYADKQFYGYLNEENHLPHAVVLWAELSAHRPVVRHEENIVQLWKLNDIDKLSFTEIADLIEASL
jgi:hypothetical protein